MKIKSFLILLAVCVSTASGIAQVPTRLTSGEFFKKSLTRQLNAENNSSGKLLARLSPFGTTAANCSDTESLFLPPTNCNGASVTSIVFNNSNRTIVSGTNNTVGVVYRYANAGTAPDNTSVDALVTVMSHTDNQDNDPTTFADADITSTGFVENLQPSIGAPSNQFIANAPWTGSIRYRIQFVVSGTNTPKVLTVAAISIDNDGSTTCGGLNESVTYSTALNQILTSPTTEQVITGTTMTARTTSNNPGIGLGANYAGAALYLNVSEFEWTYSFNTSGNCAINGSPEGRYGSLNLSCQIPNFGSSFASVTVSGTVFNDTDGLTDSTVDGTGTGTPGSTQLYANLLDQNNFVVASVPVAANGSYSFPSAFTGNYSIQLSTNQGVESSPAPIKALPAQWVNTGEFLGTGAGSDGTVNGLLPVTVGSTSVTNARFGIQQRPAAANNTAAAQANPGGTNSVTVPASTFSATDMAPGTVSGIRLTGFPTNAASIAVNGISYTAGTFPGGGITLPVNASGNPTPPIQVDPVNGAVTVAFPYRATDNAGFDSDAATASVPFTAPTLSGRIYNDANGLSDATVNGSGTNAGGGLYVNLLNDSDVVVQTISVPATGIFSFPNMANGNYKLQLTVNQGTIGFSAPSVSLPANWVNTGENIGAAAGDDGSVDSLLPVTVGAVAVSEANLGIEQLPVANNGTAVSQNNPGGTTSVTVPAATFTATDASPGTISQIRVAGFPSNATSLTINGVNYTSGSFPSGGVIVPANASGNPTQTIQVDPIDGAVTVVLPFAAVDNAGMQSASTANAGFPFTLAPTASDADISGTIYFGTTPLPDALVVLTQINSNVKSVVRTDAAGKYTFENKPVGESYVVQPLSAKYKFMPGTSLVDLLDNVENLNFSSEAKSYRPKNDFDGDGRSDIAVYRPSEGGWYVLRSSDGQMSVFGFGLSSDVPVPADFDGDGRTDYAVFRPSEGSWYIWASHDQTLHVERFGLAGDKLLAADYDGDRRADIAVYRDGAWFIRRSSDNAYDVRNFGLGSDTPLAEDFDGDGMADPTVYRPSEGNWYILHTRNERYSVSRFGLAADVPAAGDFDGDGLADIAQFRDGMWFILSTTEDFVAREFGSGAEQNVIGDYDGDGRADTALYRDGRWSIRLSGGGTVRNVNFGLPTDVLIK